MLAAGVGARLSNNDETHVPKCLLQFDGQSLLARHIEILQTSGIEKLTLVVGYRADDIRDELIAIDALDYVETVVNPDYRDGSIVSLSCAADTMRSGADILFMDADVLCDPALVQKLVATHENSHILYDTEFEPGDEPVMLCLKDDQIIEFQKNVDIECDILGEWPGFVKWSPEAAEKIAGIIERFVSEGSVEQPYEQAFREYMLNPTSSRIKSENITGLPWIEIDFPEDLTRAHNIILPLLKA
ncbi:MAG: phosphocholine cytidylyltransferase family protein [Rhodospirillaceae bacterium]|nr:phosphocholine cytidylyltransferase family protein [Rhodospirillaceae bacterium]MBT4937693.1 phosphocholine cytidylyltransferase family protein [Rhodospirillaceae bacterium]MBT7267936.1 phosphocholine cytidylyltransferase family protein [Rhodospirillaceae bacterium]